MPDSPQPPNPESILLHRVADSTPLNDRVSGIRTYLVKFWRLVAPYWQAPEARKKAWVLTVLYTLLNALQIALAARVSFATADLFNVLDLREFDRVTGALQLWIGLTFAMIVTFAVEYWVTYHLLFDWRQFLTRRYLGRYLSNGLFHQMELSSHGVDNPDQRIAVDIEGVTANTLTYVSSFVNNIANGITFGVILWMVSGPLVFSLGERVITIPGYMFWAALIYAAILLWITDKLGRPIIGLTYQHHAVEADFRYHLIRLRENSESIALLRGEAREYEEAGSRFDRIRINWLRLMRYNLNLMLVNFVSFRLSSIFPYLVAMPALMSGSIALGGFVQLREAWGRVQGSLAWFSNSYAGLAAWKASIDRVLLLEEGVLKAQESRDQSSIRRSTNDDNAYRLRDLTVCLPDGAPLIERSNLVLPHGSSVLITGQTGSGKSTLFRIFSGHWHWGSGELSSPKQNALFLPQKSYLPLGPLRGVLTYPGAISAPSDEELMGFLDACQLAHLTAWMDGDRDWANTLSGGEQQRLSIVRALIAKPDWLFLDEATSAMDEATQINIYQTLRSHLPNSTLVSISHRRGLSQFHDREIRVNPETRTLGFVSAEEVPI